MRTHLSRVLGLAIDVSRVRFWLYLAGTYMTGYVIGASTLEQFTQLAFIIHLIYFTLPANILVYSINDLADQDTDKYNQKKETREIRITDRQEEKDLKLMISTVSILSLGVLLLQPDVIAIGLFSLFIILSWSYSYPPVRLKARPVLDFSSNILYVVPGILAYYQTTGTLPTLPVWIALYLWTGAMHLLSAIPDIEADKKANIETTAVKIGRNNTLWLCFMFWLISIVIVVVILRAFTPWSYVAFLYPLIPLGLIFSSDDKLDRIYWVYPYINSILGFILSIIAGWNLLVKLFTSF